MTRSSQVWLCLIYLSACLSTTPILASDPVFQTTITAWTSTSSDVLLHALSLAYSLQDADVNITSVNAATGYPSGKVALMSKKCDFALTSDRLTAVEQSTYPSIIQVPFAGVPIVPIFNLGDPTLPLGLSRQTMSLIFSRSITMWNDPLIVRDNNLTGVPSIDLPNQPIVIILPPVTRATSTMFNNALQSLYPSVNQTINQYNNQSIYSTDPATSVVANMYSISFSSYQSAARVGVAIASFESAAGTKISISQTYIDQAVNSAASVRVQQVADPTNSQAIAVDLNLAQGSTSWPFIATEYLMIDLVESRSTCSARAAAVQFLVWAYSSDTAAWIMNLQQMAVLPSIVQSQLDILHRLQDTVMCRGSIAAARTVINGIVISGDPRSNTINSLILIEYNTHLSAAESLRYEYRWTPNRGELALRQMLANEASLAMVFSESIPKQLWQESVINNPNNWAVPLMLFGIEFGYNLQISSAVRMPSGTRLVMTLTMMAQILGGALTDWRDPTLLALNPGLAAAFAADNTDTPAPIAVILGCDSFTLQGTGRFALKVMNYWLPDFVPELPVFDTICTLNIFAGTNATVKYVATESMCGPAASVTNGSFIYRPYAEDVIRNVAPVDVLHAGTVRGASTDAMLSCVDDVIDPTSLLLPAMTSSNPNCYLFTQTLYAVVPNRFSSAQSGPGSCVSGRLSHAYAVYMYNLSNTDSALRSAGYVRVSEAERVRQMIDTSLEAQGLTCDDVSLLQANDVIYDVGVGLYGFAITIGVVGLVATFMAAAAVIVYRRHSVVITAKLSFVLLSSIGIGCAFASQLTLVSPVSDASCGAIMWLINIGFTLIYAPMLLKTARLYRMHGGGRIVSKAHRWSSERLLQAVGAFLALDIAVLIAWQGAAPFAIVETQHIHSDDGAKHIYRQCGQPSDGTPFLLVVTLVKGSSLILGAMMAFTVRRLSTAFDESKHIAILIYNTIVVSALFFPIGMTQVGNARIALFATGLLWISVVAFVVLFLPKFIAINTPKHEHNHNHNDEQDVADRTDEVKTESVGFEFANIGTMSEDALHAYINALAPQIEQLRKILNLEPTPDVDLKRLKTHVSRESINS